MHFPRFWVLGKEGGCWAWGWSDSSPEEARAHAARNARRAAAQRDEAVGRRYAYGERPLREPVLGEIKGPSGEIDAVVTRNAYGALVLNTARVMFIETSSLPHYELTRRFYEKHDYDVTGVLRDYYADGDDMVVFRKKL